MVSVFNLPNLHVLKLIVKRKIKDYEENAWLLFVNDHPNFQIARSYLANLSPEKFWAITAEYPDLVWQNWPVQWVPAIKKLNFAI